MAALNGIDEHNDMQADHMNFSLLMSTYAADRLDYLQQALRTNTVVQQLPPTQVVVVRDGPVSRETQQFLDDLPSWMLQIFTEVGQAGKTPDVAVVPLEKNSGLAHALNVGLSHCRYEAVARADGDDLSRPERFAKELPAMSDFDVVGSAIQEFSAMSPGRNAKAVENQGLRLGQIRSLPQGGEQLERFARIQSPLNHPSVIFRKSAVLSVGGYPEHAGRFEDYELWARMIMHGATMMNLPEPLVLYRVDAGAYSRRGGREMFCDELKLQRSFRRNGFTDTRQWIRNVSVRACYRLLPERIRTTGYRLLTALRSPKRQNHDVAGKAE